jgi:hypothetical protein
MRNRAIRNAVTAGVAAAVVLTTAVGVSGGDPRARTAAAAEETSIWLSDMDWTDARNGHGPVERDTSNGEDAAGDGGPITLDGTRYRKGLGVHARSSVTYDLDGKCSRLQATAGIDDEVDERGTGGSVVFQVIADGEEILDSGVRYGVQWSQSTLKTTAGSLDVDLDVRGVGSLELRAEPWYDGSESDHADWAQARVSCDPSLTPPPFFIVGADPAEPVLLPREPTRLELTLRNTSDETVTRAVSASAPDGYTVDAPAQVELAPQATTRLPVTITRVTSSLAEAELRLTVGERSTTVPLQPSDNWARIATMTASSTFPSSSTESLNDGVTDSNAWGGGGTGGWNDDTAGEFPDVVTAAWERPVDLSRVKVFTLNSATYPASRWGVRDYDVLARVAGEWRTVAQVRGNVVGTVDSRFDPVSADQIQVKILASNSGDYSRLVEVEAYSE